MFPTHAPAPGPGPITLTKLLLVEGNTPMHFFEALLRHLGLADQVEIRNFGGVPDFRAFLLALAAAPEFARLAHSVGIVRDAEEHPAVTARQSVTDALNAAGLTAARTPPIATSVFILPDDAGPGMLETLCMRAVAAESALAGAYTCVEVFFTCLGHRGVALSAEPAKHHAQAYLATRPEVQMFPGLAAYRGYWPFDNPVFDPLKKFLQAL